MSEVGLLFIVITRSTHLLKFMEYLLMEMASRALEAAGGGGGGGNR